MAESGRTEQIISQFLLKALHVVLGSRIPNLCDRGGLGSAAAARAKKRDRWFNLAIGDTPAALENLNFWHRSVMDPMVIDVMLSSLSGHETIVERWIIQYESSPSFVPRSGPQFGGIGGNSSSGSGSGTDGSVAFYTRTYKKSIVLLRSIYSTLRILPAYKAFRMLGTSNQNCNFSLSYKVSSFTEPFSMAEEQEMEHQSFTPVETQFGQLSASVTYRPSLLEFNLEAAPLLPPRIISDYVGSPAADPMRSFPSSISAKSVCATSFPLRGDRSGPVPFTRPHSWASPPMAHHPLSMSPSQSPESHATSPPPASSLGRQVADHNHYRTLSSGNRRGGFGCNEYRLSPPFSPSPTPSPPMYSNSPLRNRLLSETSPVSIPTSAAAKNLSYRTPNFSDPSRNFLPPPSPRSARIDLPLQESFRKVEGFRTGELLSNLSSYTISKVTKDGKEESGRFSGLLSSCGSPRVGFSRSSSRLSFTDDLDNCEFSCPFAVDDIDASNSHTRNPEGKDALDSAQPFSSTRKSQDAAVGVLVHMLRSAPPLRQDSYSSQSSKSEFGGDVGSSSFFMSRKTSDALEELRSYKEMKEMLLSQSGSRLLDSSHQTPK